MTTCQHNFLGESPCEYCGLWESDYFRARLDIAEQHRDEARLEHAHLLNRIEGRSATDACSGDWPRCWCDTCEARRKGQQYTVTTAGTHGVKLAFGILHEAIAAGGYSAGRIVERLREVGVSVTVSDLHGHGLQAVANAITDAASIERDLAFPVAQLRHLYENLVREGKREIADGLLSPQIRALEKMMNPWVWSVEFR